jgi:cell filamentation protein
MYEAADDPACYPGTTVLKNLLDLRTQHELSTFEAMITAQRADEPLPAGNLTAAHYRAIHRHLFQDVYEWAGQYRTIRTGREGNWFCFPENIEREMTRLFNALATEQYYRDLSAEAFAAKAAHFIANLNAIHPFREGNGRTQNVLLRLLAAQAGHPIDFSGLVAQTMLDAMVASFKGDERPLASLIAALIRA